MARIPRRRSLDGTLSCWKVVSAGVLEAAPVCRRVRAPGRSGIAKTTGARKQLLREKAEALKNNVATTEVAHDGSMGEGTEKSAIIYRMVMKEHLCPYGLKAKARLDREGFVVDDRWLTTRAETDAFQRKAGVESTPQVFIGGADRRLRRSAGVLWRDYAGRGRD
jgi:glutaredoxin